MRVVLAVALVMAGASASAQSPEPLFVYTSSSAQAASTPTDPRGAVVSRARVRMRLDVLFDQQANGGRRILLNAGTHVWTARFERLDQDGAGFRSWVGAIEGIAYSHVVFTERAGTVSGLINAVGVTYQVRTENPGSYVIEQVDMTALGDEREPLQSAAVAADYSSPIAASDDPGTFDILILYTPAARARVGDTAQIQAVASQVVSDTNTAFARSGVRARARLVGAVELGFVESPMMTSDLPALKFSSDARLLRDLLHADLVHLLVSSPDLATCGIGYLLSPETPDFDAYSIADVTCVAQYTPTHELAHNLGSHHAPEDGAAGALFPYSYAYKDPARGFRTIMAYPCFDGSCPRILNFSNPAREYNGGATGSSFQDNARSINDAAAYVANFRIAGTGVGALPAIPTGLTSTVTGNIVTVHWNPVISSAPNTTTYVLQAGTSPGSSNLFNATVGQATSASGILPPGTYYWRVIAANAAGASAPSSEQQFAIGGCAPPAAPSAFRFSVAHRTVTLMWNASGADATAYVIEAGSASALANLLVASVGPQTSVITPAPPGTYYVRVRAQNACGTSAPSNEHVIVVP